MSPRWLWCVIALEACASPPEAATPAPQQEKVAAPVVQPEERVEDSGASDAASEARAQDAPQTVSYEEPPPVVVRRHHVFATMQQRKAARVTIVSLLETSKEAGVREGENARLQRRSGSDWIDVADVVVDKLETKGSRVRGDERQLITLTIVTEHPEAKLRGAKSPFAKRTQVRLEVDRPETPR